MIHQEDLFFVLRPGSTVRRKLPSSLLLPFCVDGERAHPDAAHSQAGQEIKRGDEKQSAGNRGAGDRVPMLFQLGRVIAEGHARRKNWFDIVLKGFLSHPETAG